MSETPDPKPKTSADDAVDMTDYWSAQVAEAEKILINRDGEVCNPSVFHPSQIDFERRLNKTGNPYAPSPEQIRQKRLEHGAQRARSIISERLNKVSEVATTIADKSAFAVKVGACFVLLGQPWLGVPAIVLGAGAHVVNKHMGRHGLTKLQSGLSALDICTNPIAEKEDKMAACATLRETARHISHWETTQTVATTVVKFAFSEVHKVLSGIQLLFDLNKDLGRPQKEKPTSSQSLHGALSQVYYGLGVKKGQITAEPSP
jgi:hypothetical protein